MHTAGRRNKSNAEGTSGDVSSSPGFCRKVARIYGTDVVGCPRPQHRVQRVDLELAPPVAQQIPEGGALDRRLVLGVPKTTLA